MDYKTAQEQLQTLQGKTHYILVRLAPGADAAAVKAEIARRLPYNDVYLRDDWARRSRSYWVVSTGLGMNMGMEGGGPAEMANMARMMQPQVRGFNPGGAAQQKAAAAVQRQDRYEFVLLFVWNEPLTAASLFDAAPAAPQ